jgi:hypothetical protein
MRILAQLTYAFGILQTDNPRASIVHTASGRTETITYADGQNVKLSFDSEGNFVSEEAVHTGAQTLARVINQTASIAYALFNLIDSLFGGGSPSISAAWGSGHYEWNGNGVTFTAAGQTRQR